MMTLTSLHCLSLRLFKRERQMRQERDATGMAHVVAPRENASGGPPTTQNRNSEAYCRNKETKMARHVRRLALLVFGLTFALLPVGARADGDEDRRDGSCSQERALRIAHNYADAWNSHDPNIVVTYFTNTVFY